METSFKDMGYKVRTMELSDFHDDYGLKVGDEDDGEDEDMDDGEEEDFDDDDDEEEDE